MSWLVVLESLLIVFLSILFILLFLNERSKRKQALHRRIIRETNTEECGRIQMENKDRTNEEERMGRKQNISPFIDSPECEDRYVPDLTYVEEKHESNCADQGKIVCDATKSSILFKNIHAANVAENGFDNLPPLFLTVPARRKHVSQLSLGTLSSRRAPCCDMSLVLPDLTSNVFNEIEEELSPDRKDFDMHPKISPFKKRSSFMSQTSIASSFVPVSASTLTPLGTLPPSPSVITSLSSIQLEKHFPDRHVPFRCFASTCTKGYSGIAEYKRFNQDCLLHVPAFDHVDNLSLFGVLDGHGVEGHRVADYVKRSLHRYLEACQHQLVSSTREIVSHVFHHVAHTLESSGINCELSGTTAVLCLLVDGKTIWTANVGDSRAILAKKNVLTGRYIAVPLTKDHKPVGEERKRIVNAGGDVHRYFSPGGDQNGSMRVWIQNQAVPGLAMTRSFGDVIGQRAGIISDPDIVEHHIEPGTDAFLIMASDGVWDAMSNDEVVGILEKGIESIGLRDDDVNIIEHILNQPDCESMLGQKVLEEQKVEAPETSCFCSDVKTSSPHAVNEKVRARTPGSTWRFCRTRVSQLDLQVICDDIVAEANRRYLEKEDVTDDTSIIIVHL